MHTTVWVQYILNVTSSNSDSKFQTISSSRTLVAFCIFNMRMPVSYVMWDMYENTSLYNTYTLCVPAKLIYCSSSLWPRLGALPKKKRAERRAELSPFRLNGKEKWSGTERERRKGKWPLLLLHKGPFALGNIILT